MQICGVLFDCLTNIYSGCQKTLNENLSDGTVCTFSGSYEDGNFEVYLVHQTLCTIGGCSLAMSVNHVQCLLYTSKSQVDIRCNATDTNTNYTVQ